MKKLGYLLFVTVSFIALIWTAAWLLNLRPWPLETASQLMQFRRWMNNPQALVHWSVTAGERCQDAPMLMPTTGYIGFGWDDSFRPGHRHSGLDIFSPERRNNVTPIVAAYDGYLTREATWKSTVIIRHPDFPETVSGVRVDEQIWTYYTHMASADGTESYVAPIFPPGTHEVFVDAGTLLGYQGNWSGNPNRATGRHLHFSIVKSNASGGYLDERDINNTYSPIPFLGLSANEEGIWICSSP